MGEILDLKILMSDLEYLDKTFPLWKNNPYISLKYIIAGVIFMIASITDRLDGYLARKNNQVTTFGKFADPLVVKI